MKHAFFVSLLIFSAVSLSPVKSQEISLSIANFNTILEGGNFRTGHEDNSFAIAYIHPIKSRLSWTAGAEAGLMSWGTDMVSSLGLQYSRQIAGQWSWQAALVTQQGVVLFKPSVLYVWGLSCTAGLAYTLKNQSSFVLSTGLRFTDCPAYSNYSAVSNYLQIPVQLSYRIKL